MQVEVMKPGALIFPENANKLAVFKRDIYDSDNETFNYSYKYYNKYGPKRDSTINYSKLSNHCVDALTDFLRKEAYFKDVRNYRDSLNGFWRVSKVLQIYDEMYAETDADVYIFLDYFNFQKATVFKYENVMNISPMLKWTIILKGDTSIYVSTQIDTLSYDKLQFPQFFTPKTIKTEDILLNSSEYMAKSFGAKLIPSWLTVSRMYYGSNNQDMIKAEELALKNEWLKAAEIWNLKAKSKNTLIAAKACFNMAIACEMEGKPDLSIHWLIKSYASLPKNNEDHKYNCQRYINILAIRKKEIETLDKQVRKQENLIEQTTIQ